MIEALYRWTYLIVKYTVFVGGGVLLSILGFLYLGQNKLIYPSNVPEGSRKIVSKPSEYGMNDYQDLDLQAADGVNIKAYFIKQSPLSKTTLIYYHANAGNMGHRMPISKFLFEKLGCNILMLSYRGYGLSEGDANENGLKLDAQAALDYITGNEQLNGGKIILYGQSIGGAVAIHVASKNQGKVDALIIENTFTTLKETVQSVFGRLGFLKYFCHQKWNSLEAIKEIDSIPILFLSGKKDELVPPWMMKMLYKVVEMNSKQLNQFLEFQNGTHNDTCIQPGYFEAISLFWKKENDVNPNSDNKDFEVLVALGRNNLKKSMEKVNRTKSLTAEKAESSSNNYYDEYEGNLKKLHQKVELAKVVESCFLVDSIQIKKAHSKKSVKWATQLQEILFYDPLQKCDQMETENTLILNDMPNIVLNGSLSRNAPRWSLGSLADSGLYHQNQTETGISLIECSVVLYSQLYGLTAIPNHAYEKKVEIVYTLNDWKTVVSLPLVYHSSPDFKTDLFQFHIDLQTILPLSTLFKFCFKYTYGLDSMIIFENNHAKNFSLPLSVALPPHRDIIGAKMKRKSKIKTYSWKTKKMVSLTLQDSFNVPPPRSMIASYSLSYAF